MITSYTQTEAMHFSGTMCAVLAIVVQLAIVSAFPQGEYKTFLKSTPKESKMKSSWSEQYSDPTKGNSPMPTGWTRLLVPELRHRS